MGLKSMGSTLAVSRPVPSCSISPHPFPSCLIPSHTVQPPTVPDLVLSHFVSLFSVPSCFLIEVPSHPVPSLFFPVSFRPVKSWPVLMSSSPFVFRFGHFCSTSLRSTKSSPVASRSFPSYPIRSQVILPRFVQVCLVQIYLLSPFTLFSIDSHSMLFCYILFSPSVSNSSPFTIESLHIRLYSQPHWSKYLKDSYVTSVNYKLIFHFHLPLGMELEGHLWEKAGREWKG